MRSSERSCCARRRTGPSRGCGWSSRKRCG